MRNRQDRDAHPRSHLTNGLEDLPHLRVLVAVAPAHVRADRVDDDKDHVADFFDFALQ
jgi:hypothetical protein